MKYKKYPQYKDSGVEWLGNVPSEWVRTTLKYSVTLQSGYAFKSELFQDSGIPIIRIGDIKNKMGWDNTKKIPYENKVGVEFVIKPQDTLIALSGATTGKTCFISEVPELSYINQRVARLSYHNKFFYYVLNSDLFQKNILLSADGSAQENISNTEIENMMLSLPSEEEQQIIANYLDKATAKIDTLIEKQTKLIELLKEKRQCLISTAVTRGLDSSVPMKDSGVEWLGEIPENWILSKFGYLSIVVRGGSPRPSGDPTLFNGDYSPWVTVAEITKDIKAYITETETFLTKKGSEQCRVFSKGTLVLSNSGATLGVPKILSINANANDGVVGFENLSPKILIMYAYYYLFSLTENLRDRMNQGSGQPNLNTNIVKALQIPLPPIEVQGRLVEFIDNKISKIDILTAKAKKAIYLLKEKRTALISAAVTGKIDVREI